MDAREYMAKKGISQGRDEERPNTLEEKAWARAREAGDHRPRAGTPFDWEEWERYHGELAEDADSIEQKIDHEAHQGAFEHETAEVARDSDAVQYHEPHAAAPSSASAPPPVVPDAPAPRAALLALAVLLPPLAVGLGGFGGRHLLVNLVLTLLGWVPGAVHAWWLVRGG
ncbi:YqaE/Pmp3 family membrane protein [Halomonas sp. NO4]|uniref:YqaE/Pmp3 family membrane protein n=1 Tax=Halomonas sp. NO4 TaxID=2484813 RepID=UPI0013D38DDA|nr:YqaE/Pmp3 family membrane protein [Halomonas sp. NO4]